MSAVDATRVATPVISLEGVDVQIGRKPPRREILRGVSLELLEGEMHGLVGETGSGKSMTARAIIGLLPRFGSVTAGRIVVRGVDVTAYSDEQMRAIRGGVIGMVFQNPRAALYPLRSVAGQMGAVLAAHRSVPRAQRLARIHELLRLVGIRDAERVASAYPHQLSGGMAQRVVIATALIAEPEVLVADEPTTGLDATVQRQILELLASLQARLGLSVLMITHDLGIVAQYCHTVSVMYEGEVVEDGPMRRVVTQPEHEYTQRLIAASRLSDVDEAREAAAGGVMGDATLTVSGLRKVFPGGRGHRPVVALDDVSLRIESGTTLGLVGESGSGKSTAARCVLGLVKADAGAVDVLGRRITGARPKDLRAWRRDMQIVFQESFDSLDPRMRVSAAIGEPLLLHSDLRGAALEERIRELLALVDLSGELYDRYPHQLSGGQQQRVNIARALATNPRFIVLDEPTSSLDVSVRAGVLRLLVRLQQQLGLTYLLISHDLPTVRHVCDRVAVIYLGRIVEEGPASRVLRNPAHPYTQYLLGSELSLDPEVKPTVMLDEDAELAQDNPHGCVFAPRCRHQMPRCWERPPPALVIEPGHTAACILHEPGEPPPERSQP